MYSIFCVYFQELIRWCWGIFFIFFWITNFIQTYSANTPISLFVTRVIGQRIESLIFVTVIHSSDESNCKSVSVATNVVIKLKITTASKQLNEIKCFIPNAFLVWIFSELYLCIRAIFTLAPEKKKTSIKLLNK